jgi:hypothetical protein
MRKKIMNHMLVVVINPPQFYPMIHAKLDAHDTSLHHKVFYHLGDNDYKKGWCRTRQNHHLAPWGIHIYYTIQVAPILLLFPY